MCRSRISHAGTGETVRTPPYQCAVCAVGAGVEVLAHTARIASIPARGSIASTNASVPPPGAAVVRLEATFLWLTFRRCPACRTVAMSRGASLAARHSCRGRNAARSPSAGANRHDGAVNVVRLVSVVMGAVLALVGGMATELWKQHKAARAAARLVWLELILGRSALLGAVCPGPLAGRRLPLLGRRMDGAARPAGSRLEHEGLPRCADGLPAAPGDRRHATHGTG